MALLTPKSSLYSTSSTSSRRQDDFPSVFGIPSSPARRHRRSAYNLPPRSLGGFGPLPPLNDQQRRKTRGMRRVESQSTLTAPSSSSSSTRSSLESNPPPHSEQAMRRCSTNDIMKRLDFEHVSERVMRRTSTRRQSSRTEPFERLGRLSTSSIGRRSCGSKFEAVTERASRRNSSKFCRPEPLPEIEPVTEPEPEPEPEPELVSDLERHRPAVQVCGQASCAVEGDLFRIGDMVARLPCGHVFHRDCIQPFIFYNRDGGYCPLDGVPVPREKATLLPVWRVAHSSCASPKKPTAQPVEPPPPVLDLPPRESEVTVKTWAPHHRETCPIDGARFRQGEMCVRIKRCGHVFHARCVSDAIAAGEFRRCPVDGEKILQNNLRNCVVDTLSGENRPSLRDVAAAMNSYRSGITAFDNVKKSESKRELKVRRAFRSFRKSANFGMTPPPAPIHECASEPPHHSVRRRRSQTHIVEEPRTSGSTVFLRRNRTHTESQRLSFRHDSM